jgi:hypothetical protein
MATDGIATQNDVGSTEPTIKRPVTLVINQAPEAEGPADRLGRAFPEMVEPGGFEPPTSAMPLRRSPN